MILTIWTVILCLSLLAVIVGQYTSAPPLQLGGYLFLFLLGLVLLTGNVLYVDGSQELTVYNYANSSLVNTSNTINNVYSSFSGEIILNITLNHVFGFFMCILSAFGFTIVLVNLKGYKSGGIGE